MSENFLIERWALRKLKNELANKRIAVLIGPRQCGKTTLVKKAGIANAAVLSLEEECTLASALQDPAFLIESNKDKCLVVDEVQKAPSFLAEIRRAPDGGSQLGQFLLISSCDLRKLSPALNDADAAGDFVRLRTLTTAERLGAKPHFLERIFQGNFAFNIDKDTANKKYTVTEAIKGGFPKFIFESSKEARSAWLTDYVDHQIVADMKNQWSIRRKELLSTLLSYLAENSSKPHNASQMAKQLEKNWQTLLKYVNVLKSMFLIDEIPAWLDEDFDRTTKRSKLFMEDSGLMAHILNKTNADCVLLDYSREGVDYLESLVKTWCCSQLSAEIDLHPLWKIFHFKIRGRSIDFLLENENKELLGIEVKSSQTIHAEDFKHLHWFKDRMDQKGISFKGIVLYSGPSVLSFGNGCYAVPFAAMWSC